MANDEYIQNPITTTLIEQDQRKQRLPLYAGPLHLQTEIALYRWLRRLNESNHYNSREWHFYMLSNGGFYMAPSAREALLINGYAHYFSEPVSAETVGIFATLFALHYLINTEVQ